MTEFRLRRRPDAPAIDVTVAEVARLRERASDAEADALRLHREKMNFLDVLLEISLLPDVRCDEAPTIAKRALGQSMDT